ncbi:hypothetical protein NQ317_016322 [Molorchus minor]|uniref:Uncharacterized protein n=1 Tax=Molorchus minor TaxID=1323400 RepID=A0ABQ9J3Q7_9CUCU|nr:hypothetical protein NQ317_016322 [Molorchus minor]
MLTNKLIKKPIFSFGVDKTDASGFSFGIPSTITSTPLKPTTNASSIFGGQAKAESSAAAFSFGIPTATQSKPVTPEYVKMMPAIVTKPVLPTDNPLLKPNEKLPEKAEVAPSDFKFKVPKSDTHSDKLTSEQKPEDTAIVSSTPVSTVPKFTFKPVAVNGDISKPLIFGNKAETIATTTTFNVPSTTTNLFSFRSKQTVDSSPSVSTAITKPSQSSSTGSIFKFGSSSHSTPDKPSTLFSSIISTAPTNGFVTTNTPSFGSTSVSNFKATATSSSEVKPFAFNPSSSVSNEPPNKVAIFSFSPSSGSSIAGAASKAPGFNFGDVSKTPTFSFTSGKTEVPSFGVPSNTVFGASAAAKNGTFNFGSVSTNNTSQKAGFSFGANVNSTAAPLSGFNFGTAAAAATTSTSGTFNFAGAPPVFDTNVKPSFNFTDGNLTKYT